ncbi:hypothetical protein [Pyrococcus kukulkanii]|uniref:Uncharacterized protein n=1 Tax=Pyrococcus kukulkanii TaxID=1609559 RepID=A0ABV4T977_9EURY
MESAKAVVRNFSVEEIELEFPNASWVVIVRGDIALAGREIVNLQPEAFVKTAGEVVYVVVHERSIEMLNPRDEKIYRTAIPVKGLLGVRAKYNKLSIILTSSQP